MCEVIGGIALIWTFIACLAAIVIHEVLHALTARALGMSLLYVRPTPVGLKARLRTRNKSFWKLALFYLAGPLGNIFTAIALCGTKGILKELFFANLAIGIFNLLPIYPLDGGQILFIVLYKTLGSNRAFKLLKRLTTVLRVLLYLFGLLLTIFYKNPSLLVAAFLLPGVRLLEETVSMMKLENLISRKQRLLSRKIYAARHLVAMEDLKLGDLLQKLDYDRFHIIHILNKELDVIGQITEQQLLKALESCDASDKISDVFYFGL